jgi:hypothetical protein
MTGSTSAFPRAAAGMPDPPADKYSQLEKLASLKDRGVLSNDDFEREKKKLLG